jgi:L-fuconolactonase
MLTGQVAALRKVRSAVHFCIQKPCHFCPNRRPIVNHKIAISPKGSPRVDIVDCQVHLGPGGAAEMVAAMDALGISAALIHETWQGTPGSPRYQVDGGAFRTTSPTAELAAWTHPGRFAYLVQVDWRDPQVQQVIRLARDVPHARALRIIAGMRPEAEALRTGRHDPIFAAAEECGLPIFIAISGRTELLERYLTKFPQVKLIVDHCGMPPSKGVRPFIAQMEGLPDSDAYWASYGEGPANEQFEKVLKLADFPNVALKWGHSSALFGDSVFPNAGVRPFLRQALNAFGADRVMWASDITALPTNESWAHVLYSVIANPDLTVNERESLLGAVARRWLDWSR